MQLLSVKKHLLGKQNGNRYDEEFWGEKITDKKAN